MDQRNAEITLRGIETDGILTEFLILPFSR